MADKISDSALWAREYNRQLFGIKAALHSLRLQGQQQLERRQSGVAKRMAHTFEMVEVAFKALNTPEPERKIDPDEYMPPTQGRRQFISDLKAKQ